MLNIRKLVKNYRETGALAEQCGVFSFINDWCFITKCGAVGVVIEVEGIDYECLDQSHTNHLALDGYHTRVLTLREEPSESRPLVLQQLLRIPATYHIVTEWRAVETNEAVRSRL